MSKRNTVSPDEVLVKLIHDFRRKHGACRIEDVTTWIRENNLLPDPKFNPAAAMTKRLKQAARRKKLRDGKNRSVRELIAANVERLDERGNRYIDVVWDHIHEMTVDHAMTAFSQRDDIIAKHRRAATRDVESFLEFNPNAIGHSEQFEFAFMVEQPVPVVVEHLTETPVTPRQEYVPHDDANPISKSKGR